MATTDPVRRYYRWMAAFYDATRWMFLFDRSLAIRLLGLQPGDAVLEIGTGTGFNLPALVRAVGPLGHVTGLDFSPDMLCRARRRVRRHGWENVYLICADATACTFRRTYHAVLFSYSLSMVPNREQALNRALDHLCPGGRLGVLDFGPLAGWGPLAVPVRRWLALNHVTPPADALGHIHTRLARIDMTHRRRGYNFIAIGTLR